jgi:DNA-binding response OmpR family regulator
MPRRYTRRGLMGGEVDTVLVVDDDDSMRMLCRVNLELEGYRVLEAATLEAAQEFLRGEPVDVVLLDVHVGPANGFTLLQEIEGARVALFTGSIELDAEHRSQVDAVLTKPFTLAELSETVAQLAAA